MSQTGFEPGTHSMGGSVCAHFHMGTYQGKYYYRNRLITSNLEKKTCPMNQLLKTSQYIKKI